MLMIDLIIENMFYITVATLDGRQVRSRLERYLCVSIYVSNSMRLTFLPFKPSFHNKFKYVFDAIIA